MSPWRSEAAKSTLSEEHRKYAPYIAYVLILITFWVACTGGCSRGATDSTNTSDVKTYGLEALTAFIGASSSDHEAADIYYGALLKPPVVQGTNTGSSSTSTTGDPLPTAFPFPNQTVLAVIPSEPTRLGDRPDKSVSWLVSADILTPEGQSTWQQRVLAATDGTYRVDALPGTHPGIPANTPQASTASLSQLDAKSDVYRTLGDFLSAWLTGSGDLTRVADTTTVAAFKEPPYTSVQIISATANNVPDKIEGSITVSTSVIVTKTFPMELSYTLAMTAASGRWVVTNASADAASS